MTTMSEKAEALHRLGQGLKPQTMKFSELLKVLNKAGITTNAGEPYVGERGVASMISAAYPSVREKYGPDAATTLAYSFTDRNGNFAFEFY